MSVAERGNDLGHQGVLARVARWPLRLNHVRQLAGRHRTAEEVPLEFVAAMGSEEPCLFLGLDAFSDYANLEGLADGDDRRHDRSVASAAADVLYERLVDLERVDGKPLQVVQRRMTDAEVIDGDADSELLEVQKDLRGERRID